MPRPRRFDTDQALSSAMLVFWERGYELTSIGDLVAATGVSRHSLYGLWTDKRGLYLAVLDHYLDVVVGQVLAPLEAEDADLYSLWAFADGFLAALTEPPGAFGCLIAATASELRREDPEVADRVQGHAERMRRAFSAALHRGAALGQLRPGLIPDAQAAHLVVLARGAALEARGGADPAQLRLALTGALHALSSPGDAP